MSLDISKSLLLYCRLGDVEEVKHIISHYKLSDYPELLEGYSPICEALNYNNTEIVKLLLENEAKIEVDKNTVSMSIIHIAVFKNNIEIVQLLLDKNVNVNILNERGKTPLHVAVDQQHEEMVKLLLDNGADTELKDNHHYTPLHLAVKNGNIKNVQTLLNYKAAINSCHRTDTALHFAVKNNRTDIAQLLIENGVIDKMDSSPFHSLLTQVVLNSNHKILHPLLERRHSNNQLLNDCKNYNFHDLLHMAIVGGKMELIDSFVVFNFDVNAKDKSGKTPIFHAYSQKNTNICHYLLKNGSQIDGKIDENFTILHASVNNNDENFVEILLNNGANVNATTNDFSTCLHIACRIGNKKIVKLLIKFGCDIHVRNNNGLICLHEAARRGNEKIVKYLLRKGANINTVDDNYKTAICHAVECKNTKVVQLLLAKNPNTGDKSNKLAFLLSILEDDDNDDDDECLAKLFLFYRFSVKGENFHDIQIPEPFYSQFLIEHKKPKYKTVFTDLLKCRPSIGNFFQYQILISSVKKGFNTIVKDLLGSDANVNVLLEESFTLLEIAVSSGKFRMMMEIVKFGGNLQTRDIYGNTLLHISVLAESIDITEFLLKHNNIEARNKMGESVFHLAVKRNLQLMVKLLLNAGVDVNSKMDDDFESTALHCAVFTGGACLINVLLEYDALVNVKNNGGQTPLDIAIRSERIEIVSILLQHGAIASETDLPISGEISQLLNQHRMKLMQEYKFPNNDDESNLSDFEIDCNEELSRMQNCELGNNISLLDILRGNVTDVELFLRNKNTLLYFVLNDFELSYPIYFPIMNVRINKAKQRSFLLKTASISLENVLKVKIPYLVVQKIFSYVGNLDLRNLISASKKL